MSTAPIRLRVTATAESLLRRGHPWLYASSIHEHSRVGVAGDLAVVYDRKDRFLAIGLFDPESPLRMRVLHQGKPGQLDEDWWRAHLKEAVAKREGLADESTTGLRLVHGENDRWPGLVLDRYDRTLVLKLYTAAWFPHLSRATDLIKEILHPEHLVLRLSRNIQETASKRFQLQDGAVLSGLPLTEPVTFTENGLRFEAEVIRGQKTGFFLDQRENRRIIETMAEGRHVLNAFSFSGGFSLYAARGGAASATDLDISAHALQSSLRNFDLNQADPRIKKCPHHIVQGDVFEWMQRPSSQLYDLIILDPPSLARREAEREGALRAYSQLAEAAAAKLGPGGILAAASCSAHVSRDEFFATVKTAVTAGTTPFEVLRTTGHPPDHAASFLEAHYLKCIYLRRNDPALRNRSG